MNKIKQNILNFLKSFKISGIPAIIGILGSWSGQNNKWLRRYIIPAIFTICAYIELKSLWVILLMTVSAWLSLGYGIPDITDKGSALGRYWYKIFQENRILANIFTRGTIGLLISLSLLILPILKNNWLYYIIGSVGIILVWALISWQGFGSFKVKFFGKECELLKVDFLIYSVTGLCTLLIIYKG